ncbi:MAG: hypothetical protein HYX51_08945 [Chloroflexi bacterium]|nr:hypothetical protein [Chloroflexota bacterium]
MTSEPAKQTEEQERPTHGPEGPINWEAIELLRSWRDATDEEAEEQRETGEYLIKALNEGRKGYRLLYPWAE